MSLRFWRHKNGEVIKHDCYSKLPKTHRLSYEATSEEPTHKVVEDNGNFALSMLIAETTGSAGLGFAVGGDIGGAMFGSSLSNDMGTSSFGGF